MVKQGWVRNLAKTVSGIPSAREVIDATISAVSPSWGIKRRELRAIESIMDTQTRRLQNHFEGADNDRLRGSAWMRSRLSPDSALEQDLLEIREAADELYRTFPYLHGAIEHRAINVVGRGMRPQCTTHPIEGVFSEDQVEVWKSETEGLFNQWAKNAGPGNRQTFWSMQRAYVRTQKRIGEGLWVVSDVSRLDKPIPLQIQAIAPERLATPSQFEGDPEVRLGIRKRNGQPITYYFRKAHPYDTVNPSEEYEAVPAERVLHWYEQVYEGQSRGLPWCYATIHETRDFKDFREAVIITAQTQACQTMIVSTKGNPAAAMRAAQSENQTIPMEPGQIMFRNDVTDVHGFNPTQPGTTYGMFSEWSLFGIGAGLNYPHGWLVRDRRRASYSAGRLEEIDGSSVLEVDQQDLRDCALSPIWEMVISRAVALGKIKMDPTVFNEHSSELLRHHFPQPGRRWIDPPKEVKAAREAINENLDSKSNVVQKIWGGDWEEILRQRAREVKLEQEFNVVPPDALTAQQSQQPEPNPAEDEKQNSEEDDE